jgi:cytochrome b561
MTSIESIGDLIEKDRMTMTQVNSAFVSSPTTRTASANSYTPFAIALHWIMAALILYAGIHGLLLDGWPKETRMFWINIHSLVGLSILVLLLARMWWRWTHAPPELPADVSELSRRVSHPAHLFIYALMLATPITGIVALVWHGRGFNFGLFTVDFLINSNSPVYHQAEDIHLWLTYGLFALIGGHTIAALWHHFISRNAVLVRMLPGLSSPIKKQVP